MLDATTPPTEAQPAPHEAPPESPARSKRERKPKSPEQLRRDALAKRLKRRTERLLLEGSLDELEAAAGAEGSESAPQSAKLAPAEKTPALAPSAEDVKLWQAPSDQLVLMLANGLQGTRFAPSAEIQTELGNALAPVLAKYAPSVIATPEARLAMVLVAWLAKPTAELVAEKMAGDSKTRPELGVAVSSGASSEVAA